MPQRKNYTRHKSDEVQGDDSWIEIYSPTQGEIKDYQAKLNPLNQRIEQLKAEGKSDESAEVVAIRKELNIEGEKLLSRFVKAWNWVDNDGNPLPQPSETGAIDALTIGEIRFISNVFTFGNAEKKA